MSQFTQDLILHYFIIGTVVTLLIDLMIRVIKTTEPYTAAEVLACIVLWPMVLVLTIVTFIRGGKDV